MSNQDVQVKRSRNRLRLLILFVIFPIYKMLDFLIEGNNVWAIIMGVISLVYIVAILYLVNSVYRVA